MKVGIKTVFVALFLGLLMSIIAVLFYGFNRFYNHVEKDTTENLKQLQKAVIEKVDRIFNRVNKIQII